MQAWGTESGEIDELYSPQSLELNLDTEASERGSFGAEKTKNDNSALVSIVEWATQLDPLLAAAFSESAESDNDIKVRSAVKKKDLPQTTCRRVRHPATAGLQHRSGLPLVAFKSFRNAGWWAEEDSEQRLQP